jgi:hypothetical protein
MALSIADGFAMSKPSFGGGWDAETHLTPEEAAAYLDRVASKSERARIENHLADCERCRSEIQGLAPIVAVRNTPRRAAPWLVAAAAAIVVVVAWPRGGETPDVIHREAPVTATLSPRAISPDGLTRFPLTLRWSAVPLASSYLARIYDQEGSVLFERETTDTLLVVGRINLRSGIPYHWKVEARSGFDRRAASRLTEFTLVPPERP